MFTGIIQDMAEITSLTDHAQLRQYTIKLPHSLMTELTLGASIANNGCCLTVTHIAENHVSFDLMQETLQKTNLGTLKVGDFINIERAAKFGSEIGGHLMSGHISCTAEITVIEYGEHYCKMLFNMPEQLMKYILHKGFVGIEGASLTIGEVTANTFAVYLIPETLKRTTLGIKKQGDRVNIELDPQTQAIVDTVERVLANRDSDITKIV